MDPGRTAYNRRKAVLPIPRVQALLSRGFPGGLLCTDAGFYPHASGHRCRRPRGTTGVVVHVCLKGRGWVGCDHQPPIPVQAGELVLLGPGRPHAYGADEAEPWTVHYLHATGPALAELLPRLGPGVVQPACHLTQMATLCDQAWQALAHDPDEAALLSAAGSAWNLLLLLAAEAAGSGTNPPKDDARVLLAEQEMREHLDQPLDLAGLARAAGCSASHLTALFRNLRGRPPLAQFRHLKMTEAARLLTETDLPVAEVGRRLGYLDAFLFSRRFAAVHHLPPVRWRQLSE